jgi:ABC-2 type transport system permease protein
MTMTAVMKERARPETEVAGRAGAGLAGTLRSEITKIFSVRSTYWTLAVLVVAALAWSIADCAGVADHWATTPPQARAGLDATQDSLIGLVLFGQLVIVVLAALTITSEYSTQSIRTSLTVMPRRGVLLSAKGLVFTIVATVLAFATSFAAFLTGQALLASTHASATLSQPNVLRAVTVSALVVVICGLFTYGIGCALRSTAATMTTVYAFLFLLPRLAPALPTPWYNDLLRWIPGGQYDGLIISTSGSDGSQTFPHMFGVWGEVAVFAGYAVVTLALGAWAMHRRDA